MPRPSDEYVEVIISDGTAQRGHRLGIYTADRNLVSADLIPGSRAGGCTLRSNAL